MKINTDFSIKTYFLDNHYLQYIIIFYNTMQKRKITGKSWICIGGKIGILGYPLTPQKPAFVEILIQA